MDVQAAAGLRAVSPAPAAAGVSPRALVRLTRPRQWVKNLLVLAPCMFAGLAAVPAAVAGALAAAVLFTAAAAAAYVLNDLADVPRDRLHPVKRSRPLAAEAVTRRQAVWLLTALLGLAGVVLAAWPALRATVGGFLLLNAAYSLRLKRWPGIDLAAVSAGYLLRVQAGAAAVAVPLSPWMGAATLLLSLFLVALKRAAELRGGGAARAVLIHYSPGLLWGLAALAGASALACYAAYTLHVHPELLFTAPLVAFGLYRYAWLVATRPVGEAPEDAFFGDPALLATAAVWAVACGVALA